MSVESMAVVLHHSRATGTAKLVLLGIANHDGDGGAWPSVRTLAKYAGLTGKKENRRRRIKRILRELEGLGEIKVTTNGGGNRDDELYWLRPNLYRVTLTCPANCDRTTQHRTPDPDDDTPDELVGPFALVDNSDATPGSYSPPGVVQPRGPRGRTAPQTVHSQPSDNPVSASTTDRARPTPAPPPVDELARVRAKLAADTAATQARAKRGRS